MNFMDFKRLIQPIRNKIFLLLGRAILKAVTNSGDRQLIQVTALKGETITDIERFQEYGLETYPLVEAEVFVGFLNGNRDHGIALVVHDGTYRPTDLASGEVALYTSEDGGGDHRVHLKSGKDIDVKGNTILLDGTTVQINGTTISLDGTTVQIDGTTVSIGDIAGTLRALIDERLIVAFNSHKHGAGSAPDVPLVAANYTTAITKAN